MVSANGRKSRNASGSRSDTNTLRLASVAKKFVSGGNDFGKTHIVVLCALGLLACTDSGVSADTQPVDDTTTRGTTHKKCTENTTSSTLRKKRRNKGIRCFMSQMETPAAQGGKFFAFGLGAPSKDQPNPPARLSRWRAACFCADHASTCFPLGTTRSRGICGILLVFTVGQIEPSRGQ